MQLVPLGADGGEACGKDEKFLEDEPPARFLQSLKRHGKVHRLVGKARGAKTIAGLHGLGQNVRKRIQARVERLPDARANELVGDAGGEGINGKNPARHNASHVDWLKGGVLHLMAVAFAERAIEAVALAVVELIFYIGLVKKHEVDPARFIRYADLYKLHALADARQLRLRDDHRLKAGRIAGR